MVNTGVQFGQIGKGALTGVPKNWVVAQSVFEGTSYGIRINRNSYIEVTGNIFSR